eukprot:794695-Amphidinium_carterae.1
MQATVEVAETTQDSSLALARMANVGLLLPIASRLRLLVDRLPSTSFGAYGTLDLIHPFSGL